MFSFPVGAEDRSALILELLDEVNKLRHEVQLLRDENERQGQRLEMLSRENRDLMKELKANASRLGPPTSAMSPDGDEEFMSRTVKSTTTQSEMQPDVNGVDQEMQMESTVDAVQPKSVNELPEPSTSVRMPEFPVKQIPRKDVQEPQKSGLPETGANVPASVVIPLPVSADEKQAYTQVITYLNQNKLDQLKTALLDFLDEYGNGTYAGEANYLLGELRYEEKIYDQALENFTRIVENFPDSGKAESARLKMAYIYYAQKEWTAARELLESLSNSDDEQVSRLARKRLDRMTREQH